MELFSELSLVSFFALRQNSKSSSENFRTVENQCSFRAKDIATKDEDI